MTNMKKLTLLLFLPTILQAAPQNFQQAKKNLIKIYKNNPSEKEFYCACDFVFNGNKSTINLASCNYQPRKNQNRAARIEWEHVMPAENFGRHLRCWQDGGRKNCKKDAAFNRMEGDMHNLQPAIGEVNGDRSNYSYSLFTKTFNQYGLCQSAVDFKTRSFQPREQIRGTIARTYFYMSKQYHINLSKQDQRLMAAWDKMYPPNSWECDRNQIVKKIQGNDNSFITTQCN